MGVVLGGVPFCLGGVICTSGMTREVAFDALRRVAPTRGRGAVRRRVNGLKDLTPWGRSCRVFRLPEELADLSGLGP